MSWRFWDRDGDGVKTADEFFFVIFYPIRMSAYLFCLIYATVNSEHFDSEEFIFLVLSTFGLSGVELFFKYKTGRKG